MNMEENSGQTIFLWENITEDNIRLLRVFGEYTTVEIPERLDGKTVKEIGSYCFSKRRIPGKDISYTNCTKEKETSGHLLMQTGGDESELSLENLEQSFQLHELSEKYVKEVKLPASVDTIGTCAFYNCTDMERIYVFPELVEVGSDAFMNCRMLKHLVMRADVRQKTGLKQLLAQIKWQVEVSFEKREGQKEAVLLYPEYFESYDEIGPAHIFELNLTGEGFRARQCFREGVVLFMDYDRIFPQACVEESSDVLSRMAWDRLFYECELLPEHKKVYELYVKEHPEMLLNGMIEKRKLEQLKFFFEKGYGAKAQIEQAIALASKSEWTEGTASLITWKRDFFEAEKKDSDVKSRYSFDDF